MTASNPMQPNPMQPNPMQAGAPHAQPSGAGLPWGLGLGLSYIPIPFVGMLEATIVMAIVGARRRRFGGIVAAHGRAAANWGLTHITVTVVAIALAVGSAVMADADPANEGAWGIVAMIAILLGYFGPSVAHLVCCLIGLVRAHRRQPFRNHLAIPFLRA